MGICDKAAALDSCHFLSLDTWLLDIHQHSETAVQVRLVASTPLNKRPARTHSQSRASQACHLGPSAAASSQAAVRPGMCAQPVPPISNATMHSADLHTQHSL